MKNAKVILEEFREFGTKHYFKITNGQEYQGWIMDILDDKLSFADSGPLASAVEIEIQIPMVDLATLSYWDENQKLWVDACWDNVTETWLHNPAR
ncbi:hypothetical protein NIES37_01660 [Tolypothrix tenuis PCC 7101]|uniref:Uncharacterized protein n=2 Tax=Tolypothrix TaxID=111782 RepID=A0A1Z4MRY0_9CYAN|nr:hypothetical protein NIES37_01660 [Tolypothrix tenuis PCC 7101]BAZ73256.1 hypothetical protein NIES50_18180 [Aulosira laxa NIES-50]